MSGLLKSGTLCNKSDIGKKNKNLKKDPLKTLVISLSSWNYTLSLHFQTDNWASCAIITHNFWKQWDIYTIICISPPGSLHFSMSGLLELSQCLLFSSQIQEKSGRPLTACVFILATSWDVCRFFLLIEDIFGNWGHFGRPSQLQRLFGRVETRFKGYG